MLSCGSYNGDFTELICVINNASIDEARIRYHLLVSWLVKKGYVFWKSFDCIFVEDPGVYA